MTEEQQKVKTTPFGEEIPQIKLFSFSITSKCNMNCNFCFQNGRSYNAGEDMTFDEFRHLVDQVAGYGRVVGKTPSICLAGGEPFLNKDIERMSNYATQVLGNGSVSITTNLLLFPTKVADAVALFKRLGMPKINASIDREHLRFGKEMEAKIRTFFQASKIVGLRTTVQNVAQTSYQEKYRWPRNVSRLIPKELKEQVAKDNMYGRREFYSSKKGLAEMKGYVAKLRKGEEVNIPPFSVIMGLGLPFAYGLKIPVEVTFATDGRAYLFSGIDSLHVPQLSLGSWRRESVLEITQKNLPFKLNALKPWFGMFRTKAHEKYARFNWIENPVPKKAGLFGKVVSRKLVADSRKKRNRLKR